MSRYVSRFAAAFLWAAATILIACGASGAADYPTRTIRWWCLFPPGGGSTRLARVVAQKLSEAFHQQVVVDNRAGGGGTIGTRVSRRRRRTATRCCSATPERSRSIQVFTFTPGSTRARISRRSA